MFYISTIVTGIFAVLCLGVKESKATQLLQGKVKALCKGTGHDNLYADGSSNELTLKSFVKDSLLRPIQYLFTEPIVFFCAILCAISFGLIYGLTEGLTVAYTNPPFSNTFSQTSSSLSFIAILIGILLDVLPRFYDEHLFRKFRREGRRIIPETKIASFAVACPALAVGLWIFAWTVPPMVTTVPWPVSMIGLVLVGFALTDFSYVLFGYVTDSYGEFAASGVSALSTTRTLAAGIFPLFTYQMFSGLGTNNAATILAAVATLFALTPFLFLRYGGVLRRKSRVASNDDQCLMEENQHMEGKEDEEKRSESV